jgi:hypothetical protein
MRDPGGIISIGLSMFATGCSRVEHLGIFARLRLTSHREGQY